MSKSKKTNRTKQYSAQHLYRHIGNVMNHADKELKENNRQVPEVAKKERQRLIEQHIIEGEKRD